MKPSSLRRGSGLKPGSRPRLYSFCSGVGGLELGVERALGAETVVQAEIDPHASQVLARHWPHALNVGDLRTFDWSSLEPPEIVTAGYPCQPFSHAGKRGGEGDPRHLWPAVLDAVRVLRPRLVLLENVSGHLSLGFGRVLGDLAEAGYDAEWTCLRASMVGAPHRRERVFIAAVPSDIGHERCGGAWDGGAGPADRGVAPADTERQQAGIRHHAHRLRGRADDAEQTGVGCCPAPDASEGRRGAPVAHVQPGEPDAARLAASDSDEQGLEGGEPAERRDMPAWGDYEPAIRRWEATHGTAPCPTVRGRLSPVFVEWMLGFPSGWTAGLKRTHALRCLGNAVVPQVSELACRELAA